MKSSLSLLGGVAASALSVSSVASAHVCLDVPTSRAADMCQSHDLLEAAINTDQKVGPCGSSKGRMTTPTVYKPGETITVKWTETIDHNPSWYRISFNPDGETFEDPTSYQDNTGKHPNTLKDGIQDGSAAAQEIQVTLPNVTCDKCTLQLIQVMGDKGGNGFGGNDGSGGKADNDDLYYACADIILRGEAVAGDAGVAGDAAVGAPDAGITSDASVAASVDAGTSLPAAGGTTEAGAGTGTSGTGGGSAAPSAGASAGGTAAGGTTAGAAPVSTGGAQPTGGAPVGQAPPEESSDGCSLKPSAGQTFGPGLAVFVILALAWLRRTKRAS